MLSALFYLRLMSLRNWVRWRLRRLRQPKYLIGAIVGVAYFYFFFVRRISGPHRLPGRPGFRPIDPLAVAGPAEWAQVALAIGAILLLIVFSCMWIVPTGRAALGFSEAEIAFLFPAPVTRRALVHFRLLSAQFKSLGGALIMALLSNRWTFIGGNPLTHAIGWWFVFSALGLHYNGATFTLTRLSARGVNITVRRILVLAALAAVIAITFWRIPAAERAPAILNGPGESRSVSEWVATLTGIAPLSWAIYPLRLVLKPFLAPDGRTFLLALAPALVVIAAHYLWVVQTAIAFEEASIEHAEKRAARIAAWRSGERRFSRLPTHGRRPPFVLGNSARPEVAFFWKNLLSTWPYFNLRVFSIAAFILTALTFWLKLHPAWKELGVVAAIVATFVAGYVLIIGPQFARQDIRSDLRNMDILKTYPIAGWQVVLGELLTPTVIITGVVWLAVLVIVLNVEARGALGWLTPQWRVLGGLGIAAVIPPLVMLQVLVPNAGALIFPSWFEAGRTRGGGIDVMGQRMIFFFAQVLTMLLVLLPAILMGGLSAWLGQFLLGGPAATIGAIGLTAVVLLLEAAIAVWWLGGRFERLDISEELRA